MYVVTNNPCCYTALTFRLLNIWPHVNAQILATLVKLWDISHKWRPVTDGILGKPPTLSYSFFINSMKSLAISISCQFKVLPHLIIMNRFSALVQLNKVFFSHTTLALPNSDPSGKFIEGKCFFSRQFNTCILIWYK